MFNLKIYIYIYIYIYISPQGFHTKIKVNKQVRKVAIVVKLDVLRVAKLSMLYITQVV